MSGSLGSGVLGAGGLAGSGTTGLAFLGGLVPLNLTGLSLSQQALPGSLVGALVGLTPGSSRTLVASGSGRVALGGNGASIMVGTVASVTADGPLTVTVRETLGIQQRDSTFSVAVAARQSETVTLLAAMSAQPTAAVAGAYDRFIVALKAAGLWAALDVLYMPCHDSQSSRLNWKLPGTYTAAITGTVDFQAFKGHKSDGTSGYLASTFNPSTMATQFTANSAVVGWHCYPDFTAGVPGSTNDTNFDVGTGSGQLRVQARAGGVIAGRLNTATSGSALTVPSSIGLSMMIRRDAANVLASKDGSAPTGVANAGLGTVASSTLFWCGNVVGGNYSSRRIGCVFLGRAFSDAECAAFKAALETYFREVGTWVDEQTRGPGILSTDGTSYGTMFPQVIPAVAYVGNRRFRANYGLHNAAQGTSGEGIGAYNRIDYSDDDGVTYAFGSAVVSDTPAAESVIDPHLLGLADGRLLHVYPYNGSGGQRTVWARVLTNPAAAPASWVWTSPVLLGYGFVGGVYQDGPDYMFTLNNPLLGQSGDGDYYCRLTFDATGLPVARVVALMPNAVPNATYNDYGERILCRRADGSLFTGFRTQSQNYWYSISPAALDGASGSWGVAAPWTTVPNPSSRMAIGVSPNGNVFAVGYASSTARQNITLWRLSADLMSVQQTLLLDGRGAVSPRVSYPDIAFKGTGGSVSIGCDWDCGRGIQDPPTYTNELLAARVLESSMLVGGTPAASISTVTS